MTRLDINIYLIILIFVSRGARAVWVWGGGVGWGGIIINVVVALKGDTLWLFSRSM